MENVFQVGESLFKRAVSFFRENTPRAVFSSIVTIIILSAISFIKSVRESILDFFLFIIRKEYFYICVVFAGAYLLLLRRIRNLKTRICQEISTLESKIRQELSAPDDKADLPPRVEYFFSGNANWKIDLARKSFYRNPYCVCCDPPSVLLALVSPVIMSLDVFGTTDTHKCGKTEKKYSVNNIACSTAYERAKKAYGEPLLIV